MAETVLGGSIAFLAKLGVYDVVLPFLLVFTLVFAFLEKTKILGLEVVKVGDKTHTYTRKNLNSMVAFVMAFFVIASTQLVMLISEILANVVLIIIIIFCFMLTVGAMHKGDKEFELDSKTRKVFYWITGIGLFLILFNALGWLDKIYTFLVANWNNAHVATILMILVFVGFMLWVTGSFGKTNGTKVEDDKDKKKNGDS